MKKISYTICLSLITLLTLIYNSNFGFDTFPTKEIFTGNTILFFVIGVGVFLYYKNFYMTKKQIIKSFVFLALLLSLFLLIGESYSQLNNWNLIFGSIPMFFVSIIRFIGYYLLLYRTIYLIYEFIQTHQVVSKMNHNKVFRYIFVDHPVISSFLIMLLCWLPYIIAFYPAILSPDPSNQIKMFFGLDFQYREYVVLLDESIGITNHHPFLHTLLLGNCVWIGKMIGSDNLGLFLYSMLQTVALLVTLSYTILYMKKLNTPLWLRVATLSIYSLVPVFPFYAMSAVKDVYFGILMILYITFMFEAIQNINKDFYTKNKVIVSILILLSFMLIRNNGLHVIVLSFPFLFFLDKKNRKYLLLIFFIPILLFQGYSKILLPALKITSGSVREMLSIPFQQTARYVKEYEEDVTEEEKRVIDTVLGYDDLAERYQPEISDPVKNAFNKFATNDDLKAYFKVWFQGLLKHPNVYIEATLHNTYGYFYPDARKWYIYHKYDKRLQDTGEFNYNYNNLKNTRTILSSYGNAFPHIPILGNIVSIGFYGWLYMLLSILLLVFKKYKEILYLLPVFVLLLVCVASPVNTYFRYALPYIFAFPLVLAMFLNIVTDIKRSREK